MPIIQVRCSDGAVVEAESEVARMSVTLKKKLDESGTSCIVLDNVNSRSFSKVLEYCTAHCAPGVADLKAWDNKFVKVEPSVLCELASAAYHLEIKSMVDLTCYAIAQLLKGNTPEEIRRIFNIIYDFGPEDDVPPPTIRDKLRNKWIRRSSKRNPIAMGDVSSPPTSPVDPGSAVSSVVPPVLQPQGDTSPCSLTETRTVDELLSFINKDHECGTLSPKPKATKKSKRKKKTREVHKAQTNQYTEEGRVHKLNTEFMDNLQGKTSQPAQQSSNNGEGCGCETLKPDCGESGSILCDKVLCEECAGSGQSGDGEQQTEHPLDELDREVEEFRLRLEAVKSIAPGHARRKVNFTTQTWNT